MNLIFKASPRIPSDKFNRVPIIPLYCWSLLTRSFSQSSITKTESFSSVRKLINEDEFILASIDASININFLSESCISFFIRVVFPVPGTPDIKAIPDSSELQKLRYSL